MSIGKKSVTFTMISLLICFMILLATPLHVLAAGELVSIGTYQVTVGNIVDVPVRIANAWNVAGGSVKITFDKSIAIVQEVVAGDFGPPVFNIKNEEGFVYIAVAHQTAVGKGEAVLAVVRFKGVKEGTTTLHLEIPSLNDEKGNLITPQVTDGSLNVRREATPQPSLPVVEVGHVKGRQGSIVSIQISIANVSGMAGIQFTLTYNRSIVEVVDVSKGSFIADFLIAKNINNEQGWVKVAASHATGVSGSGSVAEIKAKLVGEPGSSTDLRLEGLKLNDEKGGPITAEVKHGFVEITGEVEVKAVLMFGSAKGMQGDDVRVQVNISNAVGVAGIQFTLTFDPSVIEIKDIHKKGLIESFIFTKNINNQEGWAKVAAASATGISGSGTIAEIEAMVVGKPGSFTTLRIVDLKLNDERGRLIVAKAEEGVVEVSEGVPHVAVRASNVHLLLGATGASKITLSKAPAGLAGYEIEVKLVSPPGTQVVDRGVADIVEVRFPEWAVLSDSSIKDGLALLKAVDIRDVVRAGDEEIELAEIVLKAKTLGEARIELRMIRMDNDNGMNMSVAIEHGKVVVAMGPPPIVGNRHPTDLDGDGLFEDVNGNDRIDFDDVVKLFKHFDEPPIKQYFKFYDFNRNGRLDFDDIVKLFKKV